MTAQQTSNLPSWIPTPARLGGMVWAARTVLRAGGFPELGLIFYGGMGDDLMCTAAAHELKKRGAGKLWQFTAYPDLFEGNPSVTAVPADFRLYRLCDMFRSPRRALEYPEPPTRHLIATICAAAGVRGEVALRPYLYLTEAERRAGRRTARTQVAIQSSSVGARYPMRNKQWPHARFQAVADALAADFDLVQLGSTSEPALDGCLDLRGKTTIRETAGILAASRMFVGLVGGLMHLARAVECRSVIVYGGREHPAQSGYSANENLYWDGPCAPCWQRDDCDYDRRCLEAIMPETVIAAARRVAERVETPLELDHAML